MYVTANRVASVPNACGSARPVRRINREASSKTPRSTAASGSWALVAHTNADHAHHTSARTSIERPKPVQDRLDPSRVVTWVTANTNTRSHRSSTAPVERSGIRRAVADPVTGAGSEARSPVVRVGKAAAVERQAAASDAALKARPQPLKLRDALVDSRSPVSRKARPVAPRGRPVGGKLRKLVGDLLQGQPHVLREDDEGYAPKDGSRVAAMAA